MTKCTNHCGGCGSHFHSLRAFDAHRSGPWDGQRLCWAADNKKAERLEPLHGSCDLTAEDMSDVRIWRDREHAGGVRTRFAQKEAQRASRHG
jgi:hypothetical protein